MKNFTYRDILRILNFASLFCLVISLFTFGLSYLLVPTYQFDNVSFVRDIKAIDKQLNFLKGKTFSYPDEYDTLNKLESIQNLTSNLSLFYFVVNTHDLTTNHGNNDTAMILVDSIPLTVQENLRKLHDTKYKYYDSVFPALYKTLELNTIPQGAMSHYILKNDPEDTFGSWAGIFFILFVFFGLSFPLAFIFDQKQRQYNLAVKTRVVNEELKNNPTDIKPAWEKAQLTLEQYYNRNLSQINMIFGVSVAVMVAGFILIAAGIIVAYNSKDGGTFIPIVSATSGIITEFIGATFIIIYNSTIKQASTYTESLEKINSVGMSVTILNSIKSEGENAQKIEDAKIEIAKILISGSNQKPPVS